MVSKQTIKDYEFNTIYDYYDYVVESVLNGQRQQAKELVNGLSKAQKKEGIKHFAQLEGNTYLGIYREVKEMLINSL